MIKCISWNVNGIRACVKKGFLDFFHSVDADFFCLQETKLQEGQIELELPGYYQFWNYAERKGYSGTAIFTKHKPLSVVHGIGEEMEDLEGRVITLEYDHYYVVTMYTPNSKRDLTRLPYRILWEKQARAYLSRLNQDKPVIFCGDLNVAHTEKDVKNDRANIGNAGFTDEERHHFEELLQAGFIDTYRYFYSEEDEAFTWWSYMPGVRDRNIGWRIDYFLVGNQLAEDLLDAKIHANTYGSDHCPVELQLQLK
ncbi:exodeoxyribonuclease-3 [Alkalihalobacillus xiaoxiensis]|uniref:Exodeoxyribonuclease-3 n=1 Tax=Shouchella xiaoxiensis TaxID=766895 RepID=A0ABS2SZT9_9BACI|nr:exodeoxyribonuclease III [Shouchella xiaoxiensis]MBM7841004.1 exodeoxyribonuclease-3 [Shouchella xiaoxiensis]